MNKRMTYLLTALLIAQSVSPLSAQSISRQEAKPLAITQDCLRTTSGGIVITPPTTTGPSISVKSDKIYATEIADARAKIDFELHNVALKPAYTSQAASLHIALESGVALTSISPTGQVDSESIKTLGVVSIYDSTHFSFEFTAKNINPASIRENTYFTFKIPGYQLTSGAPLEVKVPVKQDKVDEPTVSPDTTTSSAIKIVNLKHNSNHSRILYTLDGSDVTLTSKLYNKNTPISVGPNDTLKAVAFIGTMPSEQIVITYDNIPSAEDSSSNDNSGSNSGSGSNDSSSSNGGSGSNDNSSSNGGSGSNDNSSSNGGSGSNDNSSSNGGSGSNDSSSSNGDTDHSVETDNTTNTDSSTSETEESNPSTSDTVEISDTVSNAVATLIQQQERVLTTKVTEVPYGLIINNQKVELKNKLLVSNGRTLAPLRTIAQALNIPIHYHAESKTAIIKTADKLIEFPLGYNVAIVNGEMVQIDANDTSIMSTLQDNRTYLPLRFIAEQLGLNVHFDGEQVHIK